MIKFVRELRRRKVFRVVGSYAVIAWLLIQIIVSVEAPLGLPDWSDTVVIVALVLGFPVCAILAWLYDLTKQGIERTKDSDAAISIELKPADRWVIAGSILAAALLLGTSMYLVVGELHPEPRTLAVLPFDSISEDSNIQYLGDGMRDSLVTRLSRLKGLQIKSANLESVGQNVGRLGILMGVDVLCRGRIVERGNSFEIVAELLETEDNSIIWREQFSSQAMNLLDIESKVSQAIAQQMGFDVTKQEEEELSRASTANPAAHQFYLQGRYFWNRRTVAGFETSLEFYKDALNLDPNYALAHAGIAQTYLMLLGWGIQKPATVAAKIIDSAQTAIRLDPTLAEPYAALGYFKILYERDWKGAREDFLKAIDLNSNYSSAHHWYAFLLMTEGNMRAALQEIRLAHELEPLSPIINSEVGYFHLFARQYRQAKDILLEAQRLDPNYTYTLAYLVRAYALLGAKEEALKIVERFRAISDDDPLHTAYFALVLPSLGLDTEAQTIYEQLRSVSEEAYVMPGLLGVLAAAVGDHTAATEHFKAGLEDGNLIVSWLRDPLLDGYHADPRYRELMTEIGLYP